MCGTKLALLARNGPNWRVLPAHGELSTAVATNKPRRANFFTLAPTPGRAGRTFSHTGHSHVATMQPMTPLRPLMQASMKPPSPLHAPEQQPLKPTTPLQPKNAPKTPNSHPQRRWRFQPHTDTSKQRRHRFQTSGQPGLQGQAAVPVGGGGAISGLRPNAPSHTPATQRRRCGGRRRDRRARAGFEARRRTK